MNEMPRISEAQGEAATVAKSMIFIKISRNIGRFPLGTAYLMGAVNDKTDYDAIFFDEAQYVTKSGKSSEECFAVFEELFLKTRPEYVGFMLWQEEIGRFLEYAKFIRAHSPLTKIIVGGSDPTAFGQDMMRNLPEIDIVVKAEGELILTRILNGDDLHDIPNLVFRENDELVLTERLLNYNYELDDMPLPSREEFDMPLYSHSQTAYFRLRTTATMLFSRGCTANCSFCVSRSIYGKHRARDPEGMLQEIEELLEKYPYINNLYFTDNYFPIDWDVGKEFLRKYVERGFHKRLTFGCQIRFKSVDQESIRLLKKMRCNYLGIGLENFSRDIIKGMGKNWRDRQGDRFENRYNMLTKSGIFINYYLIINYPGMTWDDMKHNMDQIRKYKIGYTSIADLAPNPDTRIFNQLVAQSVIPPLSDPSLDWRTNFIADIYRSQDWIGLTDEQRKIFNDFLVERKTKNRRHYLFTLPLDQKLKIVYDRAGLNPIKLVRWVFRKVLFYKPESLIPKRRTNSVMDGPLSPVWEEDESQQSNSEMRPAQIH